MRVSLPVYSEADYRMQAEAACAGLPLSQQQDIMAAYEAEKAERQARQAERQAAYDKAQR